jgi:hypothetical protein
MISDCGGLSMQHTRFALLLLGAGCIAGSASMQRDDRILREIARQERWAQAALDARPAPDQLESIRGSDYGSVGAARKELQKLIQAVDRGTWIRDTTAELMKDDGDPQLAQQFERAGRLRADALQAADELAHALAEAKGGVTVADLKAAFEAMRKAQASEDRFAKQPLSPRAVKLAPSPLPVPRPFVEAAAKLVNGNPEMAKELDRLTPEEQTQIRARMADLERESEEQKHAAPPPPAAAGNSAEQDVEAQGPTTTLKISGDAAGLFANKAPRSITLREDGLFALSYDDGDYLVDPDGKLVRKETPPGAPPSAAAPPAANPAPRRPGKK